MQSEMPAGSDEKGPHEWLGRCGTAGNGGDGVS